MLQTNNQVNKKFIPATSKLPAPTSKPASSICSTTSEQNYQHHQQRLSGLEEQIAGLQNELKQIKCHLGTLDTIPSKQDQVSQNPFQQQREQYFLPLIGQTAITSRQMFEEYLTP